MADPVEIERDGAVALLRMNRPENRNALDPAMRDALAAGIESVRVDAEIRAVVLAGTRECFCAGGDLRGLARMAAGPRDIHEGRTRVRSMHRWFVDLLALEKPVIAAVSGSAFGAGLSLTLAADWVFADSSASFCSVFARIGYVPDMAQMYLLPRVVGLRAAKDMVFTARVVAAQEAQAIGLVQRLVETDVEAAALAHARRLAEAPTEAIGLAKAVMNRSFESSLETVLEQEAMAQAMCRESAFHQEAVRRFMAKEPLQYLW